jgi:hypothetical protein
LGRDPFARDAEVSFEVVIETRKPGWAARIVARGSGQGDGARELTSEAAACDSLSDAVALAIALAIDPEAVERTAREPAAVTTAAAVPPVPASTSLDTQTAPEVLAAPAQEPSVAAASSAGPSWLDARALASLGLLPGGALGFGVSGDARLVERVSATLGFEFWPERTAAAGGGHFAFGLAAAARGLCAELVRLRALGLSACGAGMLGSIHAVVLDLTPTGAGDRLWAAVRAGARVWLPGADRVRASFGLDAVAPFTRHRFTVRDVPGQIYRQSPVAVHASLGLGLRF